MLSDDDRETIRDAARDLDRHAAWIDSQLKDGPVEDFGVQVSEDEARERSQSLRSRARLLREIADRDAERSMRPSS
jgi:hypothetical protein